MPRSGEAAADVAKSPELSLAVECCRRSFRSASRKQTPLPLEAIDWRKFLHLIGFHRVEGLAWNALSIRAEAIPQCAREELAQAATAIAANDLRAKAACRQFLEEFEAEELPVLFLKGVTLGALAYGNAALKAAIDIDLLIDPADLRTAAASLSRRIQVDCAARNSAGDTVLRSWHGRWKDRSGPMTRCRSKSIFIPGSPIVQACFPQSTFMRASRSSISAAASGYRRWRPMNCSHTLLSTAHRAPGSA